MIEVENLLAAQVDADQRLFRIIDGKPLEISNISKDPTRVSGTSRGMHQVTNFAIWAAGPIPLAWGFRP